jgi:hypothetical protein
MEKQIDFENKGFIKVFLFNLKNFKRQTKLLI